MKTGDSETDSDSSVDSKDIGNDLRYINDNFDNNEYLQRLCIDNNVNENNDLNVNKDDDILQKKKCADICYFLFNKDMYLFCASCQDLSLRIFSTKVHLIKRKKR